MINQELTLPSGLKLKNRLVKAALTEGMSDEYQRPTESLNNLYRTWAQESGLGMLISGNVQVDRRFLERPRNVVIDLDYGEQDEEQLAALRKYAKAGKENDTKFIMQIGHAGRQSHGLVAKKAISPSAITLNGSGRGIPSVEAVEATAEQIQRVVEKMAYAAKIAQETGFDGVEIHAAHGYLLSSFLNPRVNKRTDSYGGTLENRMKPLLEVVRAMKQSTTAPFCIAVKLNSSDFQKGGFTVQEAAQVAHELANEGIDFLELSGGNYEVNSAVTGEIGNSGSNKKLESTRKREAFFLEFAEQIVGKLRAENITLPVMVTGGFRSRSIMNDAIEKGAADLIGIGRPLCVDPGCTKALLNDEIKHLPAPEQFLQLPGIRGWTFLQRFKKFYSLRMSASQSTYYMNFFALGAGKFNKSDKPNILQMLKKFNQIENVNARALKGYKKDDKFIQNYLK